ncbi:MAG: hypothetical protein AAGF11_43875 [Myxococcota bacterium]
MHYVCARCHHEFSADAEGGIACPNCGAEAGLERAHAVPVAMKLFGMVVAAVVVFAIGGGLVSRLWG